MCKCLFEPASRWLAVQAHYSFPNGFQNRLIFFFVVAGFYWRGNDHLDGTWGAAGTAFFDDIPTPDNGDRYHRAFGSAGYQVTAFLKRADLPVLRACPFGENDDRTSLLYFFNSLVKSFISLFAVAPVYRDVTRC